MVIYDTITEWKHAEIRQCGYKTVGRWKARRSRCPGVSVQLIIDDGVVIESRCIAHALTPFSSMKGPALW